MLDKITIVIADDHKMVRDGLKSFLTKISDFEIVAEVEDGEQLLSVYEKLMPDIALVDISMPRINGLEAMRHLHEQNSMVKIIMLSMHEEADYIMKAIQNGAKGYLLKNTDEKELEMAIRTVAEGGKYFNSAVSTIMIENMITKEPVRMTAEINVSNREKEILKLVSQGQSNKMIADVLHISIRTIETHRLNLLRKLDVSNAAEMVKKGLDIGLI
jgi:two-component system, NarL family, response regulator NreC